jgi:ABC-type polysaccharide/polyol phosphate transport system ATPase subunit
MGNTVIKVENLSKQYRLGLVGASTFKEDASRWWKKMKLKEDPFLTLGVENDRTSTSDSKFVWSLRDINFEVQQGDVLGVIGLNGAGKSTLLKILSKITLPTTGTVKAKGRIASLLEVGTGFHPELTGRENIFLNGAILGMRKHEIKSKLDEIIAFAGVERYIDTPVKRYSSGMYVRLAFAVAAHLDNEILIIDEVLAVGDAEFQKKCLGKIGNISNNEGRTVVFVSHFLNHINKLCDKGLMLRNGKVEYFGDAQSTINLYQNIISNQEDNHKITNGNNFVHIHNITLYNSDGNKSNYVTVGEKWSIVIEIELLISITGFVCALGISDTYDLPINNTWTKPLELKKSKYQIIFDNNSIFFGSGDFNIHVGISSYKKNLVTYSYASKLVVSPIQSQEFNNEIYNLDSKLSLIINQFENKIIEI